MAVNQRKAGVILSYASQFIQILAGLLYTPIMLRLLGQNEYGLYQLVYSVVAYLGLLSFGFSSSYIRFFSKYKAENNEKEIAKLNGMFLLIFLVIAGICAVCGGIMVANIESIFADGITKADYPTAKILMTLMVINLVITFPNSVFDSIVSAHERFLFQKTILVLQNLLNPFLTLPLLIMGYGSIAMVLVTTGLTFTKFIINIKYCKDKLNTHFIFKDFSFHLLKEMWIFTFFIFINLIVDQINWSVDKFLLGRYAGTIAVAIYGVGGQFNTMYIQFSIAISNVFIPKVNKIVAESNDNHQLTLLLTKVGRVQFVILTLIVSGFIFFGQPFIHFWAGKGYETSYAIALLLMIPVTVDLIQNLGIAIQRAKNMHKARSWVYLFITITNIYISILLIKKFGPIGAAMGTAISLILGNGIFMNWYYHKKIGLDMIYFWKQILNFVPAMIAPALFGIIVMKFMNINNLFILLILCIAYVGIYGISFWILGLNEEEKQILSVPIKNKIKTTN